MSSKPYRESQEPLRFSQQRSVDSVSLGSRYSDPFDDANGSTTTLVPATQDPSGNPRALPERSRPIVPRGPRKKESYASSLRTLGVSVEDDDNDGKDVVDLFPSPTHKLETSDKKDLGDDEGEDPDGKSRKARTDRHLSNLYSLYRRDTTHLNSRLSYIPRLQSSHHQRNDSQATLISSNASHLDIDLEKQQSLKLGYTDSLGGKPLPDTPPTPTPRRVLRRAGHLHGPLLLLLPHPRRYLLGIFHDAHGERQPRQMGHAPRRAAHGPDRAAAGGRLKVDSGCRTYEIAVTGRGSGSAGSRGDDGWWWCTVAAAAAFGGWQGCGLHSWVIYRPSLRRVGVISPCSSWAKEGSEDRI
ncbi:hypothetical protein H1R20_g2519, partial [Candolleomyces eurysporus]